MFSKTTETFKVPKEAFQAIHCPYSKAFFVDICLFYHLDIGYLTLKTAETLGKFSGFRPKLVKALLDYLVTLNYLKETTHGNYLLNKEVL